MDLTSVTLSFGDFVENVYTFFPDKITPKLIIETSENIWSFIHKSKVKYCIVIRYTV